jgi:hypothetical protein
VSNPRWVMAHRKRILVETLDPPPSQARKIERQRQKAFVQVSLQWAGEAARCTNSRRALVWMLLSYLAWKNRSNTFQLSNGLLARYGVSREMKRRTLAKLEAKGLIVVKRRHKCALEITLLHAPR